MPFLSGNNSTGKGRLSLTAHPAALWGEETYTPSQDYTPALQRARRVEPLNHGCGNPRCSTSWAKPWKNRRRPIFEDCWGCGPRCLETMIEGAVRREFGDGVAETELPQHRHRVPLGLVMLAHGWITHPQLQRALEGQREAGNGKIGYWLQQECGIPGETVTRALSVQWSCPVLAAGGFAPKAMALVMPRLFVEEFGLLPLHITAARTLYLASEDRLDASAAFSLKIMSGLDVESGLLQSHVLSGTRERLLDCEFVKTTQENVRNSEGLTTRIAALLADAQPVRARLVRVHQYFWLRTWLEADDLDRRTGTVPRTTEDVLDTIFTIGAQTKAKPRLQLGNQAPIAVQAVSHAAGQATAEVAVPQDAVLPVSFEAAPADPAHIEARLQPLIDTPAALPFSAPVEIDAEVALQLSEVPLWTVDAIPAESLGMVHVPSALPPSPPPSLRLGPGAFLDLSPGAAPSVESLESETLALPGCPARLSLGSGDGETTALTICPPAFLSAPASDPVPLAEPAQLALEAHLCLAIEASSMGGGSAALATIPYSALATTNPTSTELSLLEDVTIDHTIRPASYRALAASPGTAIATIPTIPTIPTIGAIEASLALSGTELATCLSQPDDLALSAGDGTTRMLPSSVAVAANALFFKVPSQGCGALAFLKPDGLTAAQAPRLQTPALCATAANAQPMADPAPSLMERLRRFMMKIFFPWRAKQS